MNVIVENLIAHLRSKQPDLSGMVSRDPKKWSISDLQDFAIGIQYIYKYLDEKKDKNEMAELREYYEKIVKMVNEARKGAIINPGYLNYIDKLKKTGEELPV